MSEFLFPIYSLPVDPVPDASGDARDRRLWMARGSTTILDRVFRQRDGVNDALADLTGGRVLFVLKRYPDDPDSAAIAMLDNQSLGGVTVANPTYGRAQITIPASATDTFQNSLTVLSYEIWLHDSAGNEWRTEDGRAFVDSRLPQADP